MRGAGSLVRKHRKACGSTTTNARCACPWAVRHSVTVDGKRVNRSAVFTTKALAEDFRAKLLVDVRSGERTFADRSRSEVPFLDYCEAWITSGSRKANTQGVYRSTIRQVAGALTGKSLAWVAGHRAFIEDLINEFKGTSYHRRLRAIIVGTCNTAVKRGDIGGHALRGLDIGKDVRITPAKFHPATHAELERLAGELGDPYALLVWLGRYAGLRIGESLGVNRADIVTLRGGAKVLRVARQRMSNGTLDALKAKQAHESRDVPLTPFLASKLADATTDADGFYFPAAWRTPVQNRFRAAAKRAGLPAGFTPHSLRHVFASDLIERGAPVPTVSRMLGHKSVEITTSVYVHSMPTSHDGILALLADATDAGRPALRAVA